MKPVPLRKRPRMTVWRAYKGLWPYRKNDGFIASLFGIHKKRKRHDNIWLSKMKKLFLFVWPLPKCFSHKRKAFHASYKKQLMNTSPCMTYLDGISSISWKGLTLYVAPDFRSTCWVRSWIEYFSCIAFLQKSIEWRYYTLTGIPAYDTIKQEISADSG